MASVAVASGPAVAVNLTSTQTSHVTAESIEKLTAGLLDLAKTKSVPQSALLGALATSGPPLPLNRLDAFGAGTVVDTSA